MLHTLSVYRHLLNALTAAGYDVSTVRGAVDASSNRPVAILRHDVEWSAACARHMARIEREAGVRSTMYFRIDTRAFDIRTMRDLQSAGFDIGYHYNVLDRTKGNFEAARELFTSDLARLRAEGIHITSAAPHGDPRRKTHTYTYNWELFTRYPSLGEELGLADLGPWGMRFDQLEGLARFSDANMRWNRGKLRFDELMSGIADRASPHLFLLVHADYWSRSRMRAFALHSAAAGTRALKLRSSSPAWQARRAASAR